MTINSSGVFTYEQCISGDWNCGNDERHFEDVVINGNSVTTNGEEHIVEIPEGDIRLDYPKKTILKALGIPGRSQKKVIDFFIHKSKNEQSKWMQTVYYWPIKYGKMQQNTRFEIETTLDFYGYSRWLHYAMNQGDKGRSSAEDCIASILWWGGLKQHLENVPQFYDALASIKASIKEGKPKKLEEIVELGSNPQNGNDRISTWSKILAAYMPGTCFIYDSRVALTLTYLSLKNGSPCYWQIPDDQSDEDRKIGKRYFKCEDGTVDEENIETATKKNRQGMVKNADNATFMRAAGLQNIVNLFNKDNEDKEIIEWFENGLDIPECYCRYLTFLDSLAESAPIRDAYDRLPIGIRDAYDKVFDFISDSKMKHHKSIMAHLEKMLFMQKESILVPNKSSQKAKKKKGV